MAEGEPPMNRPPLPQESIQPPLPELLRPEAVAKALGCSKPFVYALAKRGELPCVVMGRAIRFHVRDVITFIENHRKGAGAVRK